MPGGDIVLVPFYTASIQLEKAVITDLHQLINRLRSERGEHGDPVTMLVFGLGHDSRMWHEATGHHTYFVEHDRSWIARYTDMIPVDRIAHYEYPTTVRRTMEEWSSIEEGLSAFSLPSMIGHHAPYDIILIDGPTGYNGDCPGRVLPCFWSSRPGLARTGTRVYIDDARRSLEKRCIETFFVRRGHSLELFFEKRDGCAKYRLVFEKKNEYPQSETVG